MHQFENVNICNFATFGLIFMKFSPNCRALGIRNVIHYFISFAHFEVGKIGLGKSLCFHLSLRSLFCLFLSGRFTQVLLYMIMIFCIPFIGYSLSDKIYLYDLVH